MLAFQYVVVFIITICTCTCMVKAQKPIQISCSYYEVFMQEASRRQNFTFSNVGKCLCGLMEGFINFVVNVACSISV